MGSFNQGKNDAYNQLLLTGRGQAQNELMAQRNQPINEIIGLMNGSQIQTPNFNVNSASPIATTDNAGLINANYGQQMSNWEAEAARSDALIGGLFGLASGGLTGGYF